MCNLKDVENKYGSDSTEAKLYKTAQEREFTSKDIELAKSATEGSEWLSEPLKPIVGWNRNSLEGASKFYLREMELDIENDEPVDLTGVDMEPDK